MKSSPCRSKLDAPPRVTWEVPGVLTPQQGRVLVEQVAGLGCPHPTLVLSGRDPFARPDLWELLGLARDLDLVCLERLRSSGAHTLCLSLDGSTPVTHDAHHGVPGSFASTRQICQLGHRLGLRMDPLPGNHLARPRAGARARKARP